jgi:hypothetical protein
MSSSNTVNITTVQAAIEECSSAQDYQKVFTFSLMVTDKFPEMQTEVEVADSSVYGAKLGDCADQWALWPVGHRFTANCYVRPNSKRGRNKIVLSFIEMVSAPAAPAAELNVMMAPPCAVVLSHSRTEVLMIHALSGHAYIDFIYGFQKIVKDFVAQGRVVNEPIAAAIVALTDAVKSKLAYYRNQELETISAMDFLHRHEIPLRYTLQPPDVYAAAQLPEMQALRQLAADELLRRYAQGQLDGGYICMYLCMYVCVWILPAGVCHNDMVLYSVSNLFTQLLTFFLYARPSTTTNQQRITNNIRSGPQDGPALRPHRRDAQRRHL